MSRHSHRAQIEGSSHRPPRIYLRYRDHAGGLATDLVAVGGEGGEDRVRVRTNSALHVIPTVSVGPVRLRPERHLDDLHDLVRHYSSPAAVSLSGTQCR